MRTLLVHSSIYSLFYNTAQDTQSNFISNVSSTPTSETSTYSEASYSDSTNSSPQSQEASDDDFEFDPNREPLARRLQYGSPNDSPTLISEPLFLVREISHLGKIFLDHVPVIASHLNQMIDKISFDENHQKENYSSTSGMEEFIETFNALYETYSHNEESNKLTNFCSIFDEHIFPVLENLKENIIANEILKCNKEVYPNEYIYIKPQDAAERLEYLEKGGDTLWLVILKNILNADHLVRNRSLQGRKPTENDIEVCAFLGILNKRRIARMKAPVIAVPMR